MKTFLTYKDYKRHYSNHIKEITRLQILLNIEEKKLFELVRLKKEVMNHGSKTSFRDDEMNNETDASY